MKAIPQRHLILFHNWVDATITYWDQQKNQLAEWVLGQLTALL